MPVGPMGAETMMPIIRPLSTNWKVLWNSAQMLMSWGSIIWSGSMDIFPLGCAFPDLVPYSSRGRLRGRSVCMGVHSAVLGDTSYIIIYVYVCILITANFVKKSITRAVYGPFFYQNGVFEVEAKKSAFSFKLMYFA